MTGLRFAVVGAGTIGDVHARCLADPSVDAELVVVVDLDPVRAEKVAAAHGAARWSTDVAAALTADDVDAVAICTPSGAHADPAVTALEAGKHVVVEKPLEVSLAAADRIRAAEASSGKVATVISQHRFDRAAERLHAELDAGRLGTLTSANASCAWWRGQSYYDSGAWRGTWSLDGGGATMNQSIHVIDLLLSMLGEAVEVFAYTALLAHERIEVEDTAVAVVRFATGALATVHGTTAAYPGLDTSLRVMGTGGSAVVTDDELTFLHTTDGSPPEIRMSESGASLNQLTREDRPEPRELAMGAAHIAQLRDFTDAVATGRRPRVTTDDARAALALILGMYESASTGRPVGLVAS
ncbi:Gfo/Idh/MocA family oxidoreductase [Actinomycetospora endophytica]|uniref:Gfo/Idh/MocA family oxidoreductase n=1 Tax=Actinomycetospora endophytica TaxID=2291215 RepID=A0ABS8PBE6_9PSEU|nr:Gfo/Idh/MocA family oxidoreductase [Actinomycetospora endophytica]MCD2195595.1 Gfo/Idh/MocA family oxidoreductase [Actinomycetospora endophytica]